MADSGSTILTPLAVKVTTAGTAVQIPTSGTNFAAKAIIIQALGTNTEAVVVGDKNVKAKAGTQETPEQRGIELAQKQSISIDLNDATQVWVDARTSKDGVAYLLLLA
jgi:hypothetical protein